MVGITLLPGIAACEVDPVVFPILEVGHTGKQWGVALEHKALSEPRTCLFSGLKLQFKDKPSISLLHFLIHYILKWHLCILPGPLYLSEDNQFAAYITKRAWCIVGPLSSPTSEALRSSLTFCQANHTASEPLTWDVKQGLSDSCALATISCVPRMVVFCATSSIGTGSLSLSSEPVQPEAE